MGVPRGRPPQPIIKPVPWPDDLAEKQGERIKATRERLQWSQARLAKASGVKRQKILAVENGKLSLPLRSDELAALADALGVPRGWLAYGG